MKGIGSNSLKADTDLQFSLTLLSIPLFPNPLQKMELYDFSLENGF